MDDLNDPFDVQPQPDDAGTADDQARRARPAPAKGGSSAVLTILLLVLLFLLAFGGAMFWLWPRQPVPEEKPPEERPPTFVSAAGADKSAKTSLSKALAEARSGDRIVLLDDVIEEQVHLEGKRWTRDVIVEPSSDKSTVVWKLPRGGKPDRPLLALMRVEGLRIHNVTFDGDNQLQNLILLSGECPGVTLEEVQLRGVGKYGLRLMNCAGNGSRPITVTGLKAVASRPVEAAICFDTMPRLEPAQNKHVVIRNCLFEGAFGDPVKLMGNPVENVVIEGSRHAKDASDQAGKIVTLPK